MTTVQELIDSSQSTTNDDIIRAKDMLLLSIVNDLREFINTHREHSVAGIAFLAILRNHLKKNV